MSEQQTSGAAVETEIPVPNELWSLIHSFVTSSHIFTEHMGADDPLRAAASERLIWSRRQLRRELNALVAIRDQAERLDAAADAVIKSFRAIGSDKNGLVKWTVDATAMKALMIARLPRKDES